PHLRGAAYRAGARRDRPLRARGDRRGRAADAGGGDPSRSVGTVVAGAPDRGGFGVASGPAGETAGRLGGDGVACGSPRDRCGGRAAAVRAGVHRAERGVVKRKGPAAHPRRAGCARASAARAGRRLSRRAGPVPDTRAGRGHRPKARPPVLDLPARAMSARPLPRSRLDNLIPPLLDGQSLVALVPATGDLKWAAAAAWDVARAAAQHGRRVALVDLWIEDPTLHEVVGLAPTEGIVDAFEYGVSLTKAAHEGDHVSFI